MHNLTHTIPLILSIIAILAMAGLTLTPPTPTNVGANPSLVWGTAPGGTAIAPIATGAIITSVKITPTNPAAVANAENADGAIVNSFFLVDGFEADAEMLFDTSLAYPAVGSAVTMVLPTRGTHAGVLNFSGGAGCTSFPCTIESYGAQFERKGIATIQVKFSHHPGRDGAAS